MTSLLRRMRVLVLAVLLLVGVWPAAFAQTVMTFSGNPPNNIAWSPTVIAAPVTTAAAAAPATITLATNGLGTIRFNVSGTFTGLTGTFQCATERSASPTWKNMSTIPASGGGGKIINITAAGVYVASAAGCAQVQFNITAISTGSVVLDASANVTGTIVDATHERRATYHAGILALAPAASLTDLVQICGNATTTVRITRIHIDGISTAAATALVKLVTYSTADTVGTSTTLTDVNGDPSDPAGLAVVKAYTVNPTLGTALGIVAVGNLTTNTVASSAFNNSGLTWTFGDRWNEEMTLRGAASCLSMNGNAASFTSGAALDVDVEWTEE
jgi:hypothetical protein